MFNIKMFLLILRYQNKKCVLVILFFDCVVSETVYLNNCVWFLDLREGISPTKYGAVEKVDLLCRFCFIRK